MNDKNSSAAYAEINQTILLKESGTSPPSKIALVSFLENLLEALPHTTGLSLGLSLTRSTFVELQQPIVTWFRSKLSTYSDNYNEKVLTKLGAELFSDLGSERFHFMLVQLRLSFDPDLSSLKLAAALCKGAKSVATLSVTMTPLSSSPDSVEDEGNPSCCEDYFLASSSYLKSFTGSLSSEDVSQSSIDYLLADAFEDLGGMSLSKCQAANGLFSQFYPSDVTPNFVAKCLCVMIGPTPEGKSFLTAEQFIRFLRSIGKNFPENVPVESTVGGWPVDTFLDWVHRMNFDLTASQVIDALDCSSFYVADYIGLSVLKRFLVYETHNLQEVPLEMFYRPWTNVAGQLSLFQQCVANPDLIVLPLNTSAHHLNGLKLASGEEKMPMILIWKCPDFVAAVLRISTLGYFNQARILIEEGFKYSPDIVTATLLSTSGMVPLKVKMLEKAFSRLLLPHTNSHAILQTVWTGSCNHLTDSERRLQRSLLLHQCMKLIETWCDDTSPPSTSSNPPQDTFFNFLSVILRLQGDPIIPLALLLGSRSNPISKAVFQMWPMRNTSDVSFFDAFGLFEIVNWLSVSARLDLAITLVAYMVDAVSNFFSDNAEPFGLLNQCPRQISTLQNALSGFLTNWYMEQMCAPRDEADIFAIELRSYLSRRYPSLADIGAPIFSPKLEANYHLPRKLKRPPPMLLRHIINSAWKAISEGSVNVSPRVQAETAQALEFYLQNLNRTFATQSNPICPGPSVSNSVPQTGSSISYLAPYCQVSGNRSGAPLMAGTVQPPIGGGPPLIYLDFNGDLVDADSTPEDRQVNGFFHNLLQGSASVEESVKILYDYATHDDVANRKLLEGILRVLTAEITLHFLDYPEHALNSIMDFYGGVLAGLVNQLPVTLLSSLWTALLGRLYQFNSETPLDTPAFRSIIGVLYKTKTTFVRYANLTSAIIRCLAFKQFPPDLRETILNADAVCKSYQRPTANAHPHLTGSQSLKDLHVSGQAVHMPQPQSQQMQQSGFQTEWAPPTSPEESIRDRIVFTVNNVDRSNTSLKCKELCDFLKTPMIPWFIHYLINKRVTVENAFLDVFAEVIEQVNQRHPTTRQLAIEELYRSIKAILRNIRSDVDDSQARLYLKNLGRFLGMLTLARNRPVIFEDLNLKELILEAQEMGAVAFTYVIPFVSQVLKGAVGSIFASTPYIVAILGVLRELYENCNLKVQFKFEIEMLFKEFQLNVTDVPIPPPPEIARPRGPRYISLNAGNVPTGQHQTPNHPQQTAVTAQTRSLIVQQALHQQQPTLQPSFEPSVIDCNPRSLTALAHQQQQRLVAAAAASGQHPSLYGNVGSAAGRSNVIAALLEGAQPNPAAAAAVLAGNTHHGGADSIYSYAAAADENIRRKFDPSFLSLQQQQQLQQQQTSQAAAAAASSRQQQAAIYQQLSGVVNSSGQQVSSQNSTFNVPATAGLPHVVSAPQLASSIQGTPRDISQNVAQFHYDEVDINTVRGAVNMEDIVQYIYNLNNSPAVSSINSQAAARALNIIHTDAVKSAIVQTVEKAIVGVINLLADKWITVAVSTTDSLAKKDHAFQPDPVLLMRSARQMARHLGCGVTLSPAKEALQPSLLNAIINAISSLTKFDKLDKDAAELIAVVITSRVSPAGVAYIQKTIAERAVREIEKKFETEVKMRQELGPVRFLEQAARLNKNLPESVQLNAHMMTNIKPQAYDSLDKTIPGFAPLSSATYQTPNSHFVMQPTSATATGNPALAAAQQQILHRAVSSGVMPPQQSQAQAQLPNVSSASTMVKYLQQQQQYMQQQQQHPAAQPTPQNQIQPAEVFYNLALQFRQLFEKLMKSLHVSASSESPVLRAQQEIMDLLIQARSIASNQNSNVLSRLVSATVHSFLLFYRPSQWLDLSEGHQVMECLREMHMIIFKTLLSIEQHSWIIRQITHTWIQLPDGESSPSTNFTNPPSKVEQLSTLATLAAEKSGTPIPDSNIDTESETCKWNWEAFAELLRCHVLYLSQIDACLAPKVEAGHKLAVTFVLNLLDQYVLPTLAGSCNQVASDCALMAINATQTLSTSLGSIFKVAHKREFTVLNEFDLWLTMRALERLQLSTVISPGDFNLRLRLSCARIQAIMDWGLFDSEEFNSIVNKDSPEFGALFASISRTLEFDDTNLMKTKTEHVFRWWFYQRPQACPGQVDFESQAGQLLQFLQSTGLITNEENMTRFLRLSIIFVIDRAQNTLKTAETNTLLNATPSRSLNTLLELDSYARLLAIVIAMGSQEGGEKAKITLLNRALGILGGTLMQSHEIRTEQFNSMPFQRVMIMLLTDLFEIIPPPSRPTKKPEEAQEVHSSLTLYEYIPIAFGCLLHFLRPARMPRFQLAFLEIISHRSFMERMLGRTEQDSISAAYRCIYAQLLADMMGHIAFFLQNTITSKGITNLYVATFRLWMVLFYDFSDFVSEYCTFFCDVFPTAAIQLRNLVISSEPRKEGTPLDPLNAPPIDQLSQLEDPLGYAMKAGNRLPPVLRAEIDSYLSTRQPAKFLTDLPSMLRRVDSLAVLLASPPPLLTSAMFVEQSEGGDTSSHETAPPQPPPQGKKAKKAAAAKAAAALAHQQAVLSGAAVQANMSARWAAVGSQTLSAYGVNTCLNYIPELMTDLVVYLCITAVKNLRESGQPLNVSTVAKTPQMEILQALLLNLDDGGRYLLLNCIANQLRYMNSHTCYFSCSLLYLFSEIPSEKAKEQISRVLMERLIVNRPHPFGLLMTSAELLRNPIYKYWNHDFARCHKEMKDIVTVVARSCIPNFTPPHVSIGNGPAMGQQTNPTGPTSAPSSETKAAGVAATANLS
nr:CCR4 NOT transcription complex subunit 1 [Hymenolepis microstoma]